MHECKFCFLVYPAVDSFVAESVVMSATISYDLKTELFLVPDNLTARMYRDEIFLPPNVRVIDWQMKLFQQDNDRPYTTRLTMYFLAQKT